MTVVVLQETTSAYSTKLTTIRCVKLTGSVRKFHMPASSYRRNSATANGICKQEERNYTLCLHVLPLGAEHFVFQFAIQKFKDQDI